MSKLPSKSEVKKEIERNRNHSFYQEVFSRHEKDLDREIIDYYENEITYGIWFEESYRWAKALKQNGISKGQEFVAFMDRTPEAAYQLGASSLIGAKINLISEKFEPEYLKEIIQKAGSKIVFVQDVKVSKLKDLLGTLDGIKIVPVPYKNSMKKENPYEEITKHFYHLDEKEYKNAISELPNVYELEDFLKSGDNYEGKVAEETFLDNPLTVTYSSGTTKKGKPKGITHTNRHYITMGRYHDPEVSGIPAIKDMRTYSNIPIYSNSFLSSGLTDNLIQGGTVVFDPIDDPEYFLYGVKFHKSNMNIATTSTWLIGALNYYINTEKNEHRKFSLKDAMFNFAAGEGLSAGEEKFLNQFLRDTKAGINFSRTPISIAKMSTGGADCEHGSLFIRIFRAYFNKSPYRFFRSDPIGMKPYGFVDVQVLREDGTYADPYEYGRLVANSDCTMKEYNHNEEATKEFWVQDAYGKTWGDMKVYSYLDEKGNVTMKGRIPSKELGIPTFYLADEISKDTKNIMSCEVVSFPYNGEVVYVAHVMFQRDPSLNYNRILDSAEKRCAKKFGNSIRAKLYFRVRDIYEKYPITSSIKRDTQPLIEEGLSRVVPRISSSQYETKNIKENKNVRKLIRKKEENK